MSESGVIKEILFFLFFFFFFFLMGVIKEILSRMLIIKTIVKRMR